MNSPASAPAAAQSEDDLFTLSIIDWELGVVDRNCRKLLRVLAGIEQAYAGTSNETPGERAQLKKQLDGLQLEKADYREKREAFLLNLSQQPGLFVQSHAQHNRRNTRLQNLCTCIYFEAGTETPQQKLRMYPLDMLCAPSSLSYWVAADLRTLYL